MLRHLSLYGTDIRAGQEIKFTIYNRYLLPDMILSED